MFQHLLHEAVVKTGIKAADPKEAFSLLLEGVSDWKQEAGTEKNLQKLLLARETLGTTAMGYGVALPHTFSEDITEPQALLGISPEGIDFQALDGEPVHVMFVLLLPEESAETRKVKGQILREAHKFFSDSFWASELRKMESPLDVREFLARAGNFAPALQAAKVS
ncbi:MAG TPA: PTS sugar transporter subunit IIA [Verrucomicrobiae bacterium]|jgi:mannitol/fructose-specific phosphotransferase system IIA component (Ntr-type)|nr:PTS sugar transporter subunit IIA [Verrucomicrobiae bacterium]